MMKFSDEEDSTCTIDIDYQEYIDNSNDTNNFIWIIFCIILFLCLICFVNI